MLLRQKSGVAASRTTGNNWGALSFSLPSFAACPAELNLGLCKLARNLLGLLEFSCEERCSPFTHRSIPSRLWVVTSPRTDPTQQLQAN